jgi:CheY-like chemotaxis protein
MTITKCCILVCSDPVDQAVFTKALNDVSPQTICFTVPHALDAIYMMTKEKVIPNFIFIELNMPQMDGIEFLNAIKNIQTLKNVHVIVHAVSPQPHKILELKESGALAIYLRPYEYFGVRNMLNLYFTPELAAFQQN